MSINIITSAWNHFHQLDNEDFTGKIRQAITMSELIIDFDDEGKKRLKWLRDNTHEEIKRSIYELDRYVDPTKGSISRKSFTFDGDSFHQDRLQYFLCLAIEEATSIIYKNFKDYKLEVKINLDENMIGDNTKKW